VREGRGWGGEGGERGKREGGGKGKEEGGGKEREGGGIGMKCSIIYM